MLRVQSPVAEAAHDVHGARSHHGGDLNIVRVDAQTGSVLAQAAALHDERDHVGGRGKLDPVIHRGDDKRLSGSAGCACSADHLRIHAGQFLQEIDRPDGVPQLKAERTEVPQLFHRLISEIVGRLDGVVVTNHVIGEYDVTLARQVDGAGRNGSDVGILQPAVSPMAVRTDHGWKSAAGRGLERTVEIAGKVVARECFEQDFFDDAIAVLDASEDLWV